MTKRTKPANMVFTKIFPMKFVKKKDGKIDKKPLIKDWANNATADPQKLAEWDRDYPVSDPKYGRGYPTGNRIFVIDVDVKDGKPGQKNWEKLKTQHNIPDTYTITTRSGGRHYYYRVPEGIEIKTGTDVLGKGVDVRGVGGYVVCPPTQGYVPDEVAIIEMPGTLLEKLASSPNGSKPKSKTPKREQVVLGDSVNNWGDISSTGNGKYKVSLRRTYHQSRKVASILEVLPIEVCDDFEDWRTVAFAIHHEIGEAGWELFDDWSKQSDKYDAVKNRQMWEGIKDDKGEQNIRIGTLIHLARKHGSKIKFRQETRMKDTTLYSVDDALVHEAQIEWVIPGLVSAGTVAFFVGERGLGKTYALYDLAACKVLGEQWLKFSMPASPVLLVDEQSGHNRMAWRLQAINRARGGVLKGMPLYYYTMHRFKLDAPDEQDLRELLFTILEHGIKLVIVDALRNITLGDEDKSGDMSKLMEGLRYVANVTGCVIAIIAHPPKSKLKTIRGSGVFEDDADVVIWVEGAGGNDSPTLKFESTKTRDITGVAFAARKNFSGHLDSNDLTFHLTVEDNMVSQGRQYSGGQRYVLRYLLEHGEASVSEIKQAADICSANEAYKAVFKLAEMGLTQRTSSGKAGRGNPAIYGLTDRGRDVGERLEKEESDEYP